MNTETVLRLLKNADFRGLGVDGQFIVMEDPTCILRSFETFAEYAWIFMSIVTGFFLAGWGISVIRGAKNNVINNIRNLFIMFATLAAAVPIINTLYGDTLFAHACRQIRIPIADVQEMLDARNSKLKEYNPDDIYENWDIYDSGAVAGNESNTIAPTTITTTITANNTPNTTTSTSDAAFVATTTSAVRASEPHGTRDVIYTNPDGTQYRRTGGTRAWRNNNPGNLRDTPFSRRMGAIGVAGNFAVFPDEQTGRRAIVELMRTDTYQKLTIAGAISRYAPPHENNTAGYHRRIQELTGLSINRRVRDLNDTELEQMAAAIGKIEGWTVGETENINPEA